MLAAEQACSSPFSWAQRAVSVGQSLEAQHQRSLPASQWAPRDGPPQVCDRATAHVLASGMRSVSLAAPASCVLGELPGLALA